MQHNKKGGIGTWLQAGLLSFIVSAAAVADEKDKELQENPNLPTSQKFSNTMQMVRVSSEAACEEQAVGFAQESYSEDNEEKYTTICKYNEEARRGDSAVAFECKKESEESNPECKALKPNF